MDYETNLAIELENSSGIFKSSNIVTVSGSGSVLYCLCQPKQCINTKIRP